MKNIADFYPLSPMQQGMLFHSLVAPDSGVYVEQVSCTLKGKLNIDAFHKAWERVIDRHPILRTGFISGEIKDPVQVVHRAVSLPIAQKDWSASSPAEQQNRLADYMEAERVKGFQLSNPPLMRLALMKLGAQCWQFIWTYHHLLMDGWSSPIVFQEVIGFYNAFSRGRDLHLDLPRSYRDYIVWLKKQDAASAQAYWRGKLAGFLAPTPLITQRPRSEAEEEEERYDEREVWLSAEMTQRLEGLARQQNLTLNTLVSGAWALLLSKYAGEEDICFGATVSGRPMDLPGVEGMVGLFINTLPVRVFVDPKQPASAWLKTFQAQTVEMRQYEYSPLVDVQGWSQVPRHLPMFETILVYENYPIQKIMQEQESQDGLVVEQVQSVEQTNYPLTAVAGTSDKIMLKLVYDCRLFDAAWIDRMLGHWAHLLEGFAGQPNAPLGRLSLITEPERQQILVDWNRNAVDFPQDVCAQQMFEQWVERTPEAVAIDFEGEQLSYAGLNERANRLAHYLIARGVGREVLVGLCFQRSIDMVTAILGVLKAGGAYLPLDPAYPADRLAFMLEDSRAQLLLTHSGASEGVQAGEIPVIQIDQAAAEIAAQPAHNPTGQSAPDNLAYVIYTSGSTGRPKGVLLEHRGLCNLATQYARAIGLGPGQRMLQFFSYSFDGSVADIFGALTSGAALCVGHPASLMPGPEMIRFIRERGVTHGMMTPSALSALPGEELPTFKVMLTGGEPCTRDILEPWQEKGRRLINAYGPTEGTVISTLYEAVDVDEESQNISIGRPLPNTTLYILDPELNPLPIGVAGEVYIGGAGIARGYLNRPELTAERFRPDPFAAQPGARMYKTGDLARFRADGNVEFLGRTDDQVKIRGFRIELGEIEAALRQHEDVATAVIAAMPEPGSPNPLARQLVAYVVPREGAEISLPDVQSFLRESLPEYMLPTALVCLDALPLTQSGKINRRALPMPDRAKGASREEFIGPRDEIETQLRQIWEEVLNTRPISVRDNFFDLGGHSLLAVRIMSQVKEKMGREVELITLFQHPSIESLADALRSGNELGEAFTEMAGEMEEFAGEMEKIGADIEKDFGEDLASLLVPLQKNGSKPPVYFVHPSGGSTHWYIELAGALGKDQPFYAFQALGVNGDRPIHTTIEEMASCYVRVLRCFQPHGPYQLGSWSLGVIIVYEMAQQLRAAGEEVSLLAMLDQGPALPFPMYEDNADYLVQTFGQNVKLDLQELRKLAREDQIAHVLEKGKKARFIFPDVKLKDFSQFIHVLQTEVEAWRSYPVRPYPGKITLFRAVKQNHPRELGPDLGWGRLAQGGVEVCEVVGDHLSMMHKPHVRKLAEEMKKHLQ